MHPPPSEPLQARLHTETLRRLTQATPLFRQAGRPTPELALGFDLRGRAAGQVIRRTGQPIRIRYNLAMAQAQPAAFIADTVPHEVAHVVTAVCHPRARPHGPEWRAVMRLFGIERAERCHRFETPAGHGRRQRRWPYRCGCGEHQLSTTRHRRVQQGQRYFCRRCGEILSYRP